MRRLLQVCPIAAPAGLGGADPEAVVSGVLDILRFGKGAAESEKWAKACMASGECIKACDYGVNPRFLLTMARLAMMRNDKDPTERRKQGVTCSARSARTSACCRGCNCPRSC